MKKIAIACDRAGIELKDFLIKNTSSEEFVFIDLGTNTQDPVDYPDYAKKVVKSVLNKEVDCGVLICGTGIGMSIAANKMSGIIAAKVNTPREAALCKEHNMANVMTLAEYTENLEEILDAFIGIAYSTEERHKRRYN